MKLPCEIIQDLLPLYEDGICSKESKAAVEEHLKECDSCRTQFQNVQKFEEPKVSAQTETENRAVVKSFRKIRRRWAVSLAVMLFIIPILLLTVNQVRQEGICYTNIDEIMIAGGYMRDLKNQDWEGAFARVDCEKLYQDIQALLGMTVEDMLPSVTSVRIGQDEWIAGGPFYQTLPTSIQDEEEDLFWEKAVFDNSPLIPIDKWEKLKAEKPEFFREDGMEEIVITETWGEICYERLETKWGTFMVPQSSDLKKFRSAEDFYNLLYLIPAEVYKEALADIEKRVQEQYDYVQEHYKAVVGMSLEDFCDVRQRTYIQYLEECAQKGFVFGDSKYVGSHHVSYGNGISGWQVTYSIEVVYQGKSYTVQLSPTISDGRITDIEARWPADFAEGDIMYNALALYYH